MRKGEILHLTILSFFLFGYHLQAQPITDVPNDTIISPAQSLIFIPADWNNIGPNTIETEIANLLTDAAIDLDFIEVVDWLYTDDVIYDESIDIENQIDPPLALFIGEYGKIDHVYLFRIKSFVQEGRPDGPDNRSIGEKVSNFFINLLDDDKSDSLDVYAKNIHTEISLEIDLIDVRKAEIIETFILQADFTGGRRLISHTSVMDLLSNRIKYQLQKNYFFSRPISDLERGIILSRSPGFDEVYMGDLLEITEPNQYEYVDDAVINIPGKSVAYCKIDDITPRYYRAKMLRQWAPIDTGYTVIEFEKQVHGFSLDMVAPIKNRYVALNTRVYYSPIHKWDWGGGFRVQKANDSWNEHNWGIGFGLFGSYRFLNISRFALKTRLDADFDIFFKEDDLGETVSVSLGSIAPGICAEFVFSKNTDICILGGYRFSNVSDDWQVDMDDDEPEIDAFWEDPAPKMDLSGIFVNIGFRFFIF